MMEKRVSGAFKSCLSGRILLCKMEIDYLLSYMIVFVSLKNNLELSLPRYMKQEKMKENKDRMTSGKQEVYALFFKQIYRL